LVNLDDSADPDGHSGLNMTCRRQHQLSQHRIQKPHTPLALLPPPRRPTLFSPKSSPFSQQALDPALDSHRHKGKNTHELIVLPATRQVLPADPAMR
jgi:hypothetical protein